MGKCIAENKPSNETKIAAIGVSLHKYCVYKVARYLAFAHGFSLRVVLCRFFVNNHLSCEAALTPEFSNPFFITHLESSREFFGAGDVAKCFLDG